MRSPLRRSAVALLALLALAGTGRAQPGTLRVGTSGDYAPYSARSPEGGFEGFDISVARAYAEERGLTLELVPFRWPKLLEDLGSGRFDLAMSGVTVRPERSSAGRFSVPVAESGAVLIVREPDRWARLEALDTRTARVGVNAGGHLEPVARQRFPHATLIAIPENDAVLYALLSATVDAIVSDQPEAALWVKRIEGGAVYGPFTRDRKAYLLRADRPGLAADLDAWLLARESDGTLAALRVEHLEGVAPDPVATPLSALLAAVDERLALMPIVGASKRAEGVALEVPEREAIVLDAAVAAVAAAAERAKASPPPEAPLRAFFRAQIEAGKQVQWAAVQDDAYSPPKPLPDLEAELRPALLRIGDKIASLLVALPGGLEPASVRRHAAQSLRTAYLEESATRALADAIAALSAADRPSANSSDQLRASARAASPASTGTTRHRP
jgi:cyclohexadienyl dehydratase